MPRELAPWAAELAIFPAPVALDLGPMVRRLALALGPMRADRHEETGEPAGYDGLSRKGSYERLLPSEWLLLEEAPDEFLRRAGSAEHGFFHLGRRAPLAPHGCVALFDAGPDQIGAPRIAHLALLIALAARAESRAARLRWAALQGDSDRLIEEVSPASVRALLQARSARDPTDAALRDFRHRAGALGPHDELWLIGGERLRKLPSAAGASLLVVRDEIEADARRVSVELIPRGRPAAHALLELPSRGACARLLRDPFQAEPAPRGRLPSRVWGSDLLFSGRRLLFRTSERHLCSAALPSSPREHAGGVSTLALAEAERVLAVAADRKRIVAAAATADVVRVWGKREHFRVAAPGHRPASPLPLRPLVEMRWRAQPETYLFVDEQHRLHEIADDSVRLLRNNVAALAAAPNAAIAVTTWERADGVSWEVHKISPTGDYLLYSQKSPRFLRAVFGFDPNGLAELGGTGFAVQIAPDQWVQPAGDRPFRTVKVPAGFGVFGVLPEPEKTSPPRLLILSDDGSELAAFDGFTLHEVVKVPGGALAVVASTSAPEIAYLTRAGEIVVFSLRWNAELLRLVPEE